MKIHICYEFEKNHGGGGTSVLENLRSYLIENNFYSLDPSNADIILYNSFHSIKEIMFLKKKYPQKVFLHRVDGPMGVYNSPLDLRDEYVFLLNEYIADATIFQTEWSKKACNMLGLNTGTQKTITINNAPNSAVFNSKNFRYDQTVKFKIFYSSWSTNVNKGFDTLKWIDKNLDWDKYEFFFAGRTEHKFKNINFVGSLSKEELSSIIYSSHLFLFLSRFDPCSNSLAEAIATGIPVISYDGGGSPELLPKNALTFKENKDIPILLDQIRSNYDHYTKREHKTYLFEDMCQAYVDFSREILNSDLNKKKLTIYRSIWLKFKIISIKVLNKFKILSQIHGFITGKTFIKNKIKKLNREILSEQ